ncbi:hypothetical protein [Saliterribacillus persicus]|uniref:Permease n=1 Tax=Saliterribacillus persicus TaxID=930114 RepID=A0A368X773_9BACI|nr:hypothetical protein [Saliterribacillus persicus]RCW63046.1 hypothetical protein DFR57_12027 [Saliterribacillus persicus]
MKISSQRNFINIGFLFVFIFIARLFVGVLNDSLSVIEVISWGTLAYLSFASGYLYPQFKIKDERAQLIRQKGMFYSGFFIIIYLILIMLGNRYEYVSLNTVDALQLLISLTIITIFSSWIVFSRKY